MTFRLASESDRSIIVERYVETSPDHLFSFFMSSEAWLLWQGTEAEIDARPGGLFRVNVTGDGFVSGTFIEVTPPHRLVFTWGWEGDPPPYPIPPGTSTVEIDITQEGSGSRLLLTHHISVQDDIPMDELVQAGWERYVGYLVAVAERDRTTKAR